MRTRDFLQELGVDQILDLIPVPPALLEPSVDDRDEDEVRLDLLLRHLAGERSWDDAISERLKRPGVKWEALRVAALAAENDAELRSGTETALEDAWSEILEGWNQNHEKATAALAAVTPDTPDSRELAEELGQKLAELAVPDSRPRNVADLLETKLRFEQLRKLGGEARTVQKLAYEERSQSWKATLDAAEGAWRRLLSELRSAERKPGEAVSDALLALPSLILDQKAESLEKVADQSLNLETLELDGHPRTLPRRRRRASRPVHTLGGQPPTTENVKLRATSEAFANAATVPAEALLSSGDLEGLRQRSTRLLTDVERQRLWLGAAKTATELGLRNAALGEGLYAAGRNELMSGTGLRSQTLLLDALKCLAASPESPIDTIDDCVATLVCAAVSLRGNRSARINAVVEGWITDHTSVYEALAGGHDLDSVAGLWANELSGRAADTFLEFIAARLGEAGPLYRHCARRLLTPANTINRPDRLVRGLASLLAPAHPPADLHAALERLSEELENWRPGRQPPRQGGGARKALSDLLAELETLLGNLASNTTAPVDEVRNELLSVIQKLLDEKKSPAQLEEPRLTLAPITRDVFPQENPGELELVLDIRNADDAAPATGISITVEPDPPTRATGVTIEDGLVEVGDLEPGGYAEQALFVDIPPSILQHHGEVVFRYVIKHGDRVVSSKRSSFTVQLRPGVRNNRSSPYVTGPRVSGEQFVGRKKQLDHIRTALCGDVPKRAILVYGIRRIGKSSILEAIRNDPEISRRYYVAYWSAEDRPDSTTTVGLLIELAERVRAAVPARHRDRLPFKRDEFRENPYRALERLICAIDEVNISRRLLLLLDEFDKVLDLIRKGSIRQSTHDRPLAANEVLQPEVLGAIRKTIMIGERTHIVFAGLPRILQTHYQDRLFGLMDPVKVGPFTEKEASKVIEAGAGTMKLSPRARDLVLRKSGKQPYLLQILCDRLFGRMKFSGRLDVAELDVNEVITEEILPNESNFMDYDSLVGDDARDILLGLALAHLESPMGREYASVREIREALARRGIETTSEEILATLGGLMANDYSEQVERPLVERSPNRRDRFKLVIGMLGDHLIRVSGA